MPDYSPDLEIEGGSTPPTRRRTGRYSVTPSPLKAEETVIKSVSKNLKEMSLRVKRLASEDEDDEGPDLKKTFSIRGRVLGFLGPESKIRFALFNFLVHPCVHLFYPPSKIY